MDNIELIVKSAKKYYSDLRKDKNGRYLSWEHCYKCFHDARGNLRADFDYLSLHLAFYLASWGMYRGSSFLLQKDYKVHIPIVKEIHKEEYNCLLGIECNDLKKEDVQKRLKKLEDYMKEYYGSLRNSIKELAVKNELSTTLITKILMGTLGCVPAYEEPVAKVDRRCRMQTCST